MKKSRVKPDSSSSHCFRNSAQTCLHGYTGSPRELHLGATKEHSIVSARPFVEQFFTCLKNSFISRAVSCCSVSVKSSGKGTVVS